MQYQAYMSAITVDFQLFADARHVVDCFVFVSEVDQVQLDWYCKPYGSPMIRPVHLTSAHCIPSSNFMRP